MAEARLDGGVPQTAGWFVRNARDGPWLHNELRSWRSSAENFLVLRGAARRCWRRGRPRTHAWALSLKSSVRMSV